MLAGFIKMNRIYNIHIYMQPIEYKNHARVFSSVVDASLKIACAADGVRRGPIFLLLYLHVLNLTNLFLMIFN